MHYVLASLSNIVVFYCQKINEQMQVLKILYRYMNTYVCLLKDTSTCTCISLISVLNCYHSRAPPLSPLDCTACEIKSNYN